MRRILLLTPLFAALAACSPADRGEGEMVADQPSASPQTAPLASSPTDPAANADAQMMGGVNDLMAATVVLAPTAGNDVSGNLRFTRSGDGVRVSGDVRGLPAGGEHGFHVHENGDCSAPDATSAGGHFNPASQPHGRVGQGDHHAGDSDNLSADDGGVARVDNALAGVTLGDGAATDIIGKAVIVHANPDDYATQPTGNAGDRLACGVIEASAGR
ncbi:superoxide dismutase family protein [Luteimonas yindakuii]|uniref:Superoxide dismutase [Cu-Zn] n=1 Tax=Luteimonas yindakuii TaxID=2565782 RepID=A0A4Z1RGE5_9GAMM|nr:superoxide dismutase family protein [Luteimonas yindakuii]TKS53179.1 superoxide dismutase family protein [Luteimonas yindakuii]